MEKRGLDMMVRRTWLLSDEEREAARLDGERDGELRGELRAKRELLTHMIGLRFPRATSEFVKSIINPLSISCATELTSAIMTSNSLEELQSKVRALAPSC